jgi:DNA-binding transcriptional MerR regulator
LARVLAATPTPAPKTPAAAALRASRTDTRTDSRTRSSAQAVLASHRDDDNAELFGISELCREFGISLRTIRFYEDKGLLSPRRVGNSRVYSRRDRARLALILRSKAIGASLNEIKHYLDLYGARGEGRVQQLRFVLERTDQAITALKTRREHIDATLAELQLINASARAQLAAR